MSNKHYVSSLPPPYLISPQVGFCNIYKPTTIDNITIQQKLIKFYYGQIITTPFFSQILFNKSSKS